MFEAQEYARTIAQRIGYAIFAAVMIGSIFAANKVPAFHWWLMCTMFGFFAYSVAYAAVFAWTAKDVLDAVEEVSKIVPSEPAQSQPQAEENYIESGYVKTGSGAFHTIPADVSKSDLLAVRKARLAGELPTISPNMLSELGIVSRSAEPPNAYTVIAFLEKCGVIKSAGDRRPYQWEDEKANYSFPHPNGLN